MRVSKDLEFIYTDDSEWGLDDAYGVFRMLSHVMEKAPRKAYYADVLSSIDFSRVGPVTLAIARAMLGDVPDAAIALSDKQLDDILSARPLDPPLRLSRTAGPESRYASLGIYI